MNFLSFKHILISTRFGRLIDAYLRKACSLIPILHSLLLINKKNKISPNGFILFLYGGIGDVIMTIPLMNNLSRHGKLILYCDERIADLKFLFPVNSYIIHYDKRDFSNLQKITIENNNLIYVQTSPIIELYLIGLKIGAKYSIGFISDFSKIMAIGLKINCNNKLKYISRSDAYNHIYDILRATVQLESVESFYSINIGTAENNISFFNKKKYVVFSTTKSAQWKVGKIESIEYVKVAEYLIDKLDCDILFVGSNSEAAEINDIINLANSKNRIKNLAGQTSLESLTEILKGAFFIVSNDNGVAHLAAYLSLRIIVIYTFSDHNVYRWKYSNYKSLFIKNIECSPCVTLNKYPQDNYPVICNYSYACKNSITAHSIILKIKNSNWLIN